MRLDTVENSPSYLKNIPALPLRGVAGLSPCRYGFARAKDLMPSSGRINAAQARELGFTVEEISWVAWRVSRSHPLIRRRMKHWVADCAYKSLHFYERAYNCNDRWPLREALAVAHAYADGLASWQVLDDNRFLARAGASRTPCPISSLAAKAVERACSIMPTVQEYVPVYSSDCFVDPKENAEIRKWQFDRLIYWLTEHDPQFLI